MRVIYVIMNDVEWNDEGKIKERRREEVSTPFVYQSSQYQGDTLSSYLTLL